MENNYAESSFGSWYKVNYTMIVNDYRRDKELSGSHHLNLRLDNINGWGIGTVFFTNKDNKLVVLDWKNIISMIPITDDKLIDELNTALAKVE